MTYTPLLPNEIERESFCRIEKAVGRHGLADDVWSVVKRMIHTTGDPEYLKNVRFHPKATESGIKALKEGCPVVTDTRMVLAGISTGRLGQLGVKAHCLINDAEVAREAKRRGLTRSAVAIDKALPLLDGGVAAIGNAPTALLRLLELLDKGAVRPALIVGTPVGFVNAAESKELLTQAACPFITTLGPKGGSPVAASVINALAIMALGDNPSISYEKE